MNYLILTAATWIISTYLTSDDYAGPFGTLDAIRSRGRRLSDAFDCIVCMSFWVGATIATLYHLKPRIAKILCLPFALSAGAIAWDKWNG